MKWKVAVPGYDAGKYIVLFGIVGLEFLGI